MSNFKKLLTATVAVSGAFLLAACSKTATKSAKPVSSSGYEKSINWMTTSELESLDPAKADDTASEEQIANTYEGLYRLGENSKTVPGVATKSTTSKDGLTWTFYLRKDAKWSNGDPVTAEDFVYAWRRQVDPKTASSQVNNYEGIKNAIKISEGKKKPSSLGVKAEGKYKLVVTFEKKIPYFKVVTAISLKPLDSKAVKKYGKRYGTKSAYAVYNGPFKSVGWSGSNLTWKLVKNPYYWDKQAVKLETINYSVQKTPSTDYNLYQTGKLDAAILDTQAAKRMKGKKGYRVLTLGNTTYLCYNYKKKKIFRNANLRRAISMAIDRFGLCRTLGGNNQPAKTFTAKGVMYVGGSEYTSGVAKTSEAYNKYSKTEAKKLFNKGLAELGKSSITISIMADDTDSGKKTVEALQSELTQTLGKIKVETTTVPFKTRMARREEGKFDVMVSTWIADFNDAISFLDLLTSNNSRNYGKWSNSEYDRLIADSKTTASSSQRVSDLQKAEAILLEDEGITPIYYISTAYLIRPEIKNVYNDNLGGWQFKYASVK